MKRPEGMTNDFSNVILECLYLKDEHGWDRLPSYEYLNFNGFGYLASVINKKHSFSVVRTILGEKNMRKPVGWSDKLDDVVSECNKVKLDNGWDCLPSSEYLCDNGFGYLIKAISKHKWSVVHEALSETVRKMPVGWSDKLDDVVTGCNDVIVDNGWDVLPSQRYLCDNGFGYLVVAINNHKWSVVRDALGEKNMRKPVGWSDELDDVVSECCKVKSENGWDSLPSSSYLENNGFGYLAGAIVKHKFSVVRDALGEKLLQRPFGWSDKLDNVVGEFNRVKIKEGWDVLPSAIYLRNNGFNYLVTAISKHGGLVKFRSLLNKENGLKSESDSLDDFMGEYMGGAA